MYYNARGIKSKLKSLKEILFETDCDIFAVTDLYLKKQKL